MYHLPSIITLCTLGMIGCVRNNRPTHISNTIKQNIDSIVADSTQRAWHTAFNKGLGLSDLASCSHEVYRFIWWRSFGPSFVYQIEKLSNKQYLLTTTVFHARDNDPKLKNAKWRRGKLVFNGVTNAFQIAETSKAVSAKEWERFRKLLRGSYYWSFEDPTPDYIVMDGESWTLESKALVPRYYDTIIRYHETHMLSPFKGSFTQACVYLGTLSGIGMPDLLNGYYK